jgi:uncharacterized protein (DUF1800 family)
MKALLKFFYIPLIALTGLIFFSSFLSSKNDALTIAYKKAGLSDREAALHLLNRFTYGVRSEDIDQALKMGLGNWLNEQLKGNLEDEDLKNRLKNYDAINLTNTQVEETYPKGAKVLRMAIKDGFIDKDSVNKADNKKDYRDKLQAYMQQKGIKPPQELYRQFVSQKILRATYSNNQLREVLTDFWFNHFNVSLTKNDCAMYIPAYERDVIRPNVFGKFDNLLIATAKSPAMLFYLDNFSSQANESDQQQNMMGMMENRVGNDKNKLAALQKFKKAKKTQGLNENYAREVMELHTLGVDGGYTQTDVTQAARVLTGWTINPSDKDGYGGVFQKMIDKVGKDKLEERGFVFDGDFLFAQNRHDTGDKLVLGKKFSNNGYKEGVELLEMLAHNPSTAKFISSKIAVRFVSDKPSKSLVDNMSKTFLSKDGDIKQVLLTMVESPEFWNKDALREKTKSPFELAISSVRSLNADLVQPYQLYGWINKMGQKMYYYQAPTGFPDRAQYWINTGALLNRMNFGLALAAQKIPGIKINLASLNNNHEPESSEAALKTYGKIIMPDRNLDETIKRLTPLLTDPELVNKIDNAASKNTAPTAISENNEDMMMASNQSAVKTKGNKKYGNTANQKSFGDNSMLAQVVGIIIGSPEFQKR